MKSVLTVVCAVAVLVAIVPSSYAADTAAGKEMYAKKCASCHGAVGEGKDSIAKMLKVEMKPLNSKEVQAESDAQLKKAIVEGTGKMKPVAGVDAKAADDVVAFVRTLKK